METNKVFASGKVEESPLEIDFNQKTLSSTQLMVVWKAYQRLRHEKPELFGLKSTGLASLDYILQGGVEFGQYVLVGGAQKSGKTTLLKHLAQSYGEQDVNSIFFSAEMTNLQLGTMFISSATQIERSRIRGLGLEVEDWDMIENASENIGKLSLTFNYGFSTLRDMINVINAVESVTGRPIRAVFGDYIHLMEGPKGMNRQEQLAMISRGLKTLSITRELPIAVFFAAQLNRESVKGAVIEATSFLGSGQLERDMDIGMIIHNVKDEIDGKDIPNQKQITIVGSRETGVGECRVSYNGTTASLSNNVKIVEGQKESWWMP
jgi:replicative DNA helicase